MLTDEVKKKIEKLIARHNVILMEDESYCLNHKQLLKELLTLYTEMVEGELRGLSNKLIKTYDSLIDKAEGQNTIAVYLLTQKVISNVTDEYLLDKGSKVKE